MEGNQVKSVFRSSSFQKLIQCSDTKDGSQCLKNYKGSLIDELRPKLSSAIRVQLESCLDTSALISNDMEMLLNTQTCFNQVDFWDSIEQFKIESKSSSLPSLLVVIVYGLSFGLIIYSHRITRNKMESFIKQQSEKIKGLDRMYENYQITIENNHERLTNLVGFVNNLNQTVKSEIRNMKIKFSREEDLISDVEMLAVLFLELKNEFKMLSNTGYYYKPTNSKGMLVPRNTPDNSYYNTFKSFYDFKTNTKNSSGIDNENIKFSSDINLNSNAESELNSVVPPTSELTTATPISELKITSPDLFDSTTDYYDLDDKIVKQSSTLRVHTINSTQLDDNSTISSSISKLNVAKNGDEISFDTIKPSYENENLNGNRSNKINFDIATPEGRDKLKDFLSKKVNCENENFITTVKSEPLSTSGSTLSPEDLSIKINEINESNPRLRYEDLPRFDHNMKKLKRIFIPERGWVSHLQIESEEKKYGSSSFIQMSTTPSLS
ncbi:hypothetical protein DFJ63DRAFT_338932 [Scheffersomyces coipomensis]|uniref:uncharacterized protein n=1 Tax=Scheffersomyces coipomensis TaxID=1788519 RepID=UPI00315C68BB